MYRKPRRLPLPALFLAAAAAGLVAATSALAMPVAEVGGVPGTVPDAMSGTGALAPLDGLGRGIGGDLPVSAQDAAPILGAALTILTDGTEPWEDRPFTVQGLGTLPGRRGVADPGDDIGPRDGVVRSWDAVVYRASLSVRDAPAEAVVAEVTLSGPVVWDAGQLAALELAGCPEGATLLDGGRRLRCRVGRVAAPPAVTVALDLTARVSGAALQGDLISAGLTVRATAATPDPEIGNCPLPQANGCDAGAPQVSVSAAPAAELRKFLAEVRNTSVGGLPGRQLTWHLDVVLGADGDVRGSSVPVGEPWTLPDWWSAIGYTGRRLDLPVRLLGCTDLDRRSAWSCGQPNGPGTPLEITINHLDVDASLPQGVTSSLPQVVARAQVVLWIPEADLQAANGDVTFQNCFATEVGYPSRTLWQPVDARGQVNLGGMQEPPGNNCSHVVLPVARTVPNTPVPPRPPGRPGPPPRNTPAPWAQASKRYIPYTSGAAVTDGTEFAAELRVQVGGNDMPNVIACDKWDNSSHSLRDGGAAGARVWWQAPGEAAVPAADRVRVLVEYATGRWGRMRPAQVSVGRSWYDQAMATCGDGAPMTGAGWFAAADLDFANLGRGRLDARQVNMVRARFLDPIPPGVTVWLEVLFTAERNAPGTWLMNYGAAGWRAGSSLTWRALECYGAQGSLTRRECPVPAAGTRALPGPFGDMLVHVGVPLWISKHTDPVVPGGSPVVNAGEKVAFVLEAATFPRPNDPPPPAFPPGAFAPGVTLVDILPAGLFYLPGSATIASEDLNGNGILDPGEDLNGNGRIDQDVPFEPLVTEGPGEGETSLRWSLGDLPYQVRVPAIRYEAETSRLVRGGSALANRAGLWAANDSVPDCRPGRREAEGGRCAWAQVIVANIAAAQVEKVPRVPLILPGEPLVYRLALANLTNQPVEWFDAVDLLPWPGEPRNPVSRLTGGIQSVTAESLPGGAPIQIWASATDPQVLDVAGGGLPDGLVDPVAAWGGPGVGLGGPDWPCRLSDVATARCPAIASRARVTALRLWGPDPRPGRSGPTDSFLPPNQPPRYVDVTLHVPGALPGDLAHNAWGGRFESLPLPVFDNAIIRVRAPDTPTPTVTPTASHTPLPTPTFTAAPPSATPTASNTPTMTPTATATPIYPIYLPVLLSRPCSGRPVDVVLVVDASSSMLREAGDGGTKQDAVLRAARAFLDRFQPEVTGGRVAVVAFNDRAWVLQALTADRARLDAALDRLPMEVAEGTRLDLALEVGARAAGEAQPGRWRALVLLTDGMPNRVPIPPGGTQEDTVLAVAARVRAQGLALHTVGYGRADAEDLADRILPWLLRAIAGYDAGYHETDDAGELAEVFLRIAAELRCVGEDGWP